MPKQKAEWTGWDKVGCLLLLCIVVQLQGYSCEGQKNYKIYVRRSYFQVKKMVNYILATNLYSDL